MNHLTTHVSASLCSSQVCRNFAFLVVISHCWIRFMYLSRSLPSKVFPFCSILLVYSTNLNSESVLGDLHTSFERAGNTRRQPDVVFTTGISKLSSSVAVCPVLLKAFKAPPRPSNYIYFSVYFLFIHHHLLPHNLDGIFRDLVEHTSRGRQRLAAAALADAPILCISEVE